MADEIIYHVKARKGEDTEFYLKRDLPLLQSRPFPTIASLEQKFSKFLFEGQLKILNVAVQQWRPRGLVHR